MWECVCVCVSACRWQGHGTSLCLQGSAAQWPLPSPMILWRPRSFATSFLPDVCVSAPGVGCLVPYRWSERLRSSSWYIFIYNRLTVANSTRLVFKQEWNKRQLLHTNTGPALIHYCITVRAGLNKYYWMCERQTEGRGHRRQRSASLM